MNNKETLYALFTPKTNKRVSQWYVKLGAAKLEWERKGKRHVIKDNHEETYE